MAWWMGLVGGILVLLGLVWIGQGLNLLTGSGMSGHPVYAVLGLLVALVGGWLLWRALPLRDGASVTARGNGRGRR